MKFTDEHKQVTEFADSNKIPFGVSKVQIMLIEEGQTDNSKDYIEFTVIDKDEHEDTARVWFSSDAAANFAFNTCRQIYVHNAPEEHKDAARATMDAVKDTTELVEKLNEKLIGKEAWFTKYYDEKRTYKGQDGKTYRSINKNIMGYEPKLKPELMPQKSDADKVKDVFPGAQEVPFESKGDAPGSKASDGIPKNW